MRLILLALVLAAAGAAHAQGGRLPTHRDRYLYTEQEGVMLLPPERVSGAVTVKAHWSPTGRYVFAVREERSGDLITTTLVETVISVRDTSTGRSRDVLRLPERMSVDRPQWLMPNGNVAYFAARVPFEPGSPRHEGRLYFLDATSGRCVDLADSPRDRQYGASPRQPLLYVYADITPDRRRFLFLGPRGEVLRTIDLGVDVHAQMRGWSPDGRRLVVNTEIGEREIWRTVGTTGLSEPTEAAPPMWVAPPYAHPFRIRLSTGALREGATEARLRPLWLESIVPSEAPRALVAPDGEAAEVSPKGDAVLYLSEGGAYTAPLRRMPKATMMALRREAARAAAMKGAKFLAAAIHMWSTDWDDELPQADDPEVALKIQPYLRDVMDPSVMVYTYRGGPIKTIASPATTTLGYVPADGGRAYFFADGHVEWKADGR